MKRIKNPKKETWQELTQRPLFNDKDLAQVVSSILQNVRNKGDEALLEYSRSFDHVELSSLQVSVEEINLQLRFNTLKFL